MSIYFTNESALCCPLCGDDCVHLEQMWAATRKLEGGPLEETVIAATGDTHTNLHGMVPRGDRVGDGKRHRFVLSGYCESCLEVFALVFTQHRGRTITETVHLGPLADAA